MGGVPAPLVLIAASPAEGELVRRAVERAGLRASVCDRAAAALALAEAIPPSVVVLASGLRAGTPREVIDGLRARRGHRIPVVLLDDEEAYRDEPANAEAAGADLLLVRPVDPALLVERIALLSGVVPADFPAPADEATPPLPVVADSRVLLRADEALGFAATFPDLSAAASPAAASAEHALDTTLPGLLLESALCARRPTVPCVAPDPERVAAKSAQVREGDYFAILDLDRAADGADVAAAWRRLREEFAGDEPGAEVAEILAVIDEARRVLADDALRAAYRAHLDAPARTR